MRRIGLPLALCLVAVFGLEFGIAAGGLWDPHELSFAELSRRLAVNLLGGGNLRIPGADNTVPIRADLGRGELPFTSVALGFRLFGLSAWAGRLPLALWGLAGVGALYAALSALADRRAALYGVLILATTPLYFLQARTLLGDAVTLASFTIAWSSCSAAVLAPQLNSKARAGFALLGALGLYAGFWCRGPILNVAVPALSVGLVAGLRQSPTRFARFLAVGLLVLGSAALLAGGAALHLVEQTREYSVFVGTSLIVPDGAKVPPSFDVGLGRFAHAAFPWTALAPLALALPETDGSGAAPSLRPAAVSALLGWSLALAACAWLQPSVGELPLPAAGCFAALLAFGLSALEKRPRALPLVALCGAALALLIGFDLHAYPDKALAAYGLATAKLPEGLLDTSSNLWRAFALVLAFGIGALLFDEENAGSNQRLFRVEEYRQVLARLQRAFDGNAVFALVVLEAGLVGFLVLSAISERIVHLESLDAFGSTSRTAVAAMAVLTPVAGVIALPAMAGRDAARWLFRRSFFSRPQAVLLVCGGIGTFASLHFYPAVARQLAPQHVFERYHELSRGPEPLGMLGEGSVSAHYQAGASAVSLSSLPEAFSWLDATRSTDSRRWLLVRGPDLAELNALFRARHRRNLPVLDARSSELMLATTLLRPGEVSRNPLDGLVLDEAPAPQHPLRAVLGHKLETIGWSLTSSDGRPALRLRPGTSYRFTLFYRVLAPLSGRWQTFVHVDGLQRRFNADHVPLDGKYPLALWASGDVIVDSTELALEPNFSPGRYQLRFGFFAGTQRLAVVEGPAEDDRVLGGMLEVE